MYENKIKCIKVKRSNRFCLHNNLCQQNRFSIENNAMFVCLPPFKKKTDLVSLHRYNGNNCVQEIKSTLYTSYNVNTLVFQHTHSDIISIRVCLRNDGPKRSVTDNNSIINIGNRRVFSASILLRVRKFVILPLDLFRCCISFGSHKMGNDKFWVCLHF